MRNAPAWLLAVPLVGCITVGPEDTDVTPGGGGGISGAITANTEWSGAVTISGITTIAPGVTVTVAAGTTLTMKSVAELIVEGVFDVQGTSAGKVVIKPEKPELPRFEGISVSPTGEVRYKFVRQTGGGIFLNGGNAHVTIADSHLSQTQGDFLMMSGGTLDVSYTSVGEEPGTKDTTHCDLHFGGAGNVIKVTHSNISTSSYGLMFYGGNRADFTFNNWFENTVDVDTTQAAPVSGDFSNGWFDSGPPSGAGITVNTPSGTRLPACNGSNNDTCAGPRG